MKAILKNIKNRVGMIILFMALVLAGQSQKVPCGISKNNGGGFSTTIQSVVCNTNGTYTIVFVVQHDGCSGPGCKALSHYSVETNPGTYSNIMVEIISGGMTYSNIDLGPNLGSDPFQGFKIDGVNGIGDGQAGSFTITYTLAGALQDQQVSAKAGTSPQIVSFTVSEFTSVMNCNNTGCSTPVTGPDAINDNATTMVNTPVNISILTNDIPGSGALVPGSVTFITGTEPSLSVGVFTLTGTGMVTFTPANNYTGMATIQYQVCDVNSLCDIATITVTIPSGDSDNDGCPDEVDQYPDDPTKCFDNEFPATGTGTLAFEDLWPGRGDYDFNDLVCDYKFIATTNAENLVVGITATFTVKAFGASLHNGFGFQFPNSNIIPGSMAVTGYNLQETYIVLNEYGLEAGQDKPTVIVFDDAYNLMPSPGMGIGVNTTPGAPYVNPVTLTIQMSFSSPQYTLAQINLPKFNPFIIVDKNRGLEVHLPDYAPTSLANPAYFGQADDSSNPESGRYYKTLNNLPWAINIYESFAYPKEKTDIIHTYNHFVEWAVSGGVSFPDWYKNLPGYRNTGNLY